MRSTRPRFSTLFAPHRSPRALVPRRLSLFCSLAAKGEMRTRGRRSEEYARGDISLLFALPSSQPSATASQISPCSAPGRGARQREKPPAPIPPGASRLKHSRLRQSLPPPPLPPRPPLPWPPGPPRPPPFPAGPSASVPSPLFEPPGLDASFPSGSLP